MTKRNSQRVAAVIFILSAVIFACEYPVTCSGVPMPQWVKNPNAVLWRQKEISKRKRVLRKDAALKNETYVRVRVYSGLGDTPDNAKKDAEAKLVRDLRTQFGIDCSIENDVVKCNGGLIIAKYRIEDEWCGQCFVDKFVVYLLVQSIDYNGKYINIISDK